MDDEDEQFQVHTVDDVDYLVDMESFMVTGIEDDEEVGVWDDETNSIQFFADMDGAEDGAETEAEVTALPAGQGEEEEQQPLPPVEPAAPQADTARAATEHRNQGNQ